MGIFDDKSSNEPVPGGNLAKPVLIAIGALLVGRMFSGKSADTEQPTAHAPAETPAGGGLGALLEQLTQAGHAEKVDSWVGSGQNVPIAPDQLGHAIGKDTITDLANQSGVNEQDLLAELSKALPGIVDKLTENGQLPDMDQVLKMFSQK